MLIAYRIIVLKGPFGIIKIFTKTLYSDYGSSAKNGAIIGADETQTRRHQPKKY